MRRELLEAAERGKKRLERTIPRGIRVAIDVDLEASESSLDRHQQHSQLRGESGNSQGGGALRGGERGSDDRGRGNHGQRDEGPASAKSEGGDRARRRPR